MGTCHLRPCCRKCQTHNGLWKVQRLTDLVLQGRSSASSKILYSWILSCSSNCQDAWLLPLVWTRVPLKAATWLQGNNKPKYNYVVYHILMDVIDWQKPLMSFGFFPCRICSPACDVNAFVAWSHNKTSGRTSMLSTLSHAPVNSNTLAIQTDN